MLSFIDPFLVLCVFVCYICVSFALSVSSFRSRAPRSRSDGGSDATAKGSRARGSIIAACLHVLSLSHTHTLFCGQEDATFHESAVLLNVN